MYREVRHARLGMLEHIFTVFAQFEVKVSLITRLGIREAMDGSFPGRRI